MGQEFTSTRGRGPIVWLRWAAPAALGAAIGWLCFGRPARPLPVRLRSHPTKAAAWIDGRFAGVTPLVFHAPGLGEYRVTLVKHGFVRRTKVIRVRGPMECVIRLERAPSRRLLIATRPSGALVTVRGVVVGKTPLVLDGLSDAALPVTIEKQGYESISETIPLTSSETRWERELKSRTEEFFKQKIAEDPQNLNNYTELLHHYMITRRYDDAARVLRDGLSVLAGQKKISSRWGSPARRFYEEIRKIYAASYDYGDAEAVDAMRRQVEDALLDAIKQFPRCTTNYTMLARLFGRSRRRGQLFARLERLAEQNPGDAPLQRVLGEEFYRQRRYAEAADALKRAVKRNPKDFYAQRLLGQALINLGRREEGVKHLRIALDLTRDPRLQAQLRAQIARAETRRGRADPAETLRRRADAARDARTAALLRLRAAACYLRQRRYDEAQKMYEAVVRNPGAPALRAAAERGLRTLQARRRR